LLDEVRARGRVRVAQSPKLTDLDKRQLEQLTSIVFALDARAEFLPGVPDVLLSFVLCRSLGTVQSRIGQGVHEPRQRAFLAA